MSAPACAKPSRAGYSCIESLAGGWILATDLCWACTRAFMAALDGIGGPLVWHANYIERADATARKRAEQDDAS